MCSCGQDLPKHFWGNGSTGELWLFFWLQRTVRQPLGESLWQTPWWFHIASEGSTAQSWLRDFTEAGFLNPVSCYSLVERDFFQEPGENSCMLCTSVTLSHIVEPQGPVVLCASKTLSHHQDAYLLVSQSSDKAVLQRCVTAELTGSCSCWHSWSGCSCCTSQCFSEPLPGQSTHCSSGITSETHLEASTRFV